MINICCLWVNDKYNYEYVEKLYNNIKRFIEVDFEFYCFLDTDDKINQLNSNIKSIKLSGKYKTVWNKIEIISTKINDHNNLFFDLDTLILDSFQDLVDWAIEYKGRLLALCFAIWRMELGIGFYQFARDTNQSVTPYNSSIMCWCNDINIDMEIEYHKYNGFDEFLWMNWISVDNIPPEYYYSGFFEDFKHLDFPICLLNQTHDKNEILKRKHKWIERYW